MIRIFFPGQNVPDWLEKIEPTKGCENDQDTKMPTVKFGCVSVVAKYRGHYFVWGTMLFGKCTIRIEDGGGEFTMSGGGKGVKIASSLRWLFVEAKRIYLEQKGGAA